MKKIVEMWNRVVADREDIGWNSDRCGAGTSGAGGNGNRPDRNHVRQGAQGNCADTGVCPCHQLNCKCRKGKWPAVPYGDDHVYAQHAMRSGSGGERKFYFPYNHDTGP